MVYYLARLTIKYHILGDFKAVAQRFRMGVQAGSQNRERQSSSQRIFQLQGNLGEKNEDLSGKQLRGGLQFYISCKIKHGPAGLPDRTRERDS